MQERTISPFARPFYIMAKPAGAACNLACRYCYYLEKSRLYADDSRHMMSDEMLERFTKEYIEAQATSDILFTWHGGETLLRPIAFYEKAIALQRRYGLGRNIDNAIQTNGTLIDERWAQFFAVNGWLVGVSIDGPEAFHDEYRRSRQGEGSFARVMQGIEILNRYGVQWNAMAVVNNDNGSRPLEFYRFFKSIGCHYLQFTPVVERALEPDCRDATALGTRLLDLTQHVDGGHLHLHDWQGHLLLEHARRATTRDDHVVVGLEGAEHRAQAVLAVARLYCQVKLGVVQGGSLEEVCHGRVGRNGKRMDG